MKKSKQSVKVQEDILTVGKILDKEQLKDLADKIVSEDIDNIILVYTDKQNKTVTYATTIKQWAIVFGSLEMVHHLMMEEWEVQRYGECEA